jgi:hypothetical protein
VTSGAASSEIPDGKDGLGTPAIVLIAVLVTGVLLGLILFLTRIKK